jgi:hypothetical protein
VLEVIRLNQLIVNSHQFLVSVTCAGKMRNVGMWCGWRMFNEVEEMASAKVDNDTGLSNRKAGEQHFDWLVLIALSTRITGAVVGLMAASRRI